MSTIKNKLLSEIKSAMKSKNKSLLGILRLISAAIKQVEIDTRTDLDDTAILAILAKMIKQRQESLRIYTEANRMDLADIEEYEITMIREFLPAQLTDSEIETIVIQKIAELGINSKQEMGKLMAVLKTTFSGKADMAIVSKFVKQHI